MTRNLFVFQEISKLPLIVIRRKMKIVSNDFTAVGDLYKIMGYVIFFPMLVMDYWRRCLFEEARI
jgi:hypothetical protein